MWPYVASADALSESHAATAVLMLLSVMTYPSLRRVAKDVFADPKGRAAARCGEASSTPRARMRPAELPEPDKRVPTPVIAAAELRAVARTAMASQVVVVVEGQRRVGIVSEMLPGCRLGVCMRVGAAF